jgi:hypothetical protein
MLEVDERQVVLGHPDQGPERPENRYLAPAAEVLEEEPARVTGDERPVYVEKSPNARHAASAVYHRMGGSPEAHPRRARA